MRLNRGRQFMAVYEARVRVTFGPLLVYGRPNEPGHPRLGLAVPRAVGGAVARNTIKRRLREAFRLMQHDKPSHEFAYDLVISVRPHEPMKLEQYQKGLSAAIDDLHALWLKKMHKQKRSAK